MYIWSYDSFFMFIYENILYALLYFETKTKIFRFFQQQQQQQNFSNVSTISVWKIIQMMLNHVKG